ncbi:MAG: cobyrinate a,c-diamide synthase [Oscillospiraceae bacterium]|nr:cobyrinate a,c-diamide synthase [Oscillospiraceae bacterium]
MRRLMLAAMNSGSGKTVFTCGLLAALKARGLSVLSFKCGPDYIDPMFHRQVLGVPSRNLDLFLQGEAGVRRTLGRQSAELALIEGAMGFYDGVKGTDRASAWDIARTADVPVVLILRPKGASLTLAAQIRGLQSFRTPSHIAGLLLNDCKPSLYAYLKPILERETGLPVVGYLPPMEEAVLESRHLGLLTAGEIENLTARFEAITRQMEQTVDIDALLALAGEAPEGQTPSVLPPVRCKIAVARDEAFCFCYEDNLDLLRENGAELAFFSPLYDQNLPLGVDGLYLPGGYPELYAQALSENTSMRERVRQAVTAGLPTVAECGGFLYLQEALEGEQGKLWPMAGALLGAGYRTNCLQRFGYKSLTADGDSLLLRAGESVPVHEFHYWDSTVPGTVLSETMYAGFPHLHFGGVLPLAERFVAGVVRWRKEHG